MNDELNNFKKRFSLEAKSILVGSQKIALSLNQELNSNHILAAIVSAKGTLSSDLLREEGMTVEKINRLLSPKKEVNKNEKQRPSISSDGVKTIKLSFAKAKKFKHSRVGSEHLLLAIIYDKNLEAYELLKNLQIDIYSIKEKIESIFKESNRIEKLENMMSEGDIFGPGLAHEIGGEGRVLAKTKTKKKTPALDFFATDLTQKAKKNELDPLINRQDELERTIKILNRRTKNNPVLVGDPGVGKTAIVEGLAQKIIRADVPPILRDKRLLSLDMSLLVAGTKYRGEFEERIKKVVQEIKDSKNIILFVDEIHNIVGAGSAEGSIDAANILKPQLSKGELRLIGAT